MKIVVDINLSPDWVPFLTSHGFDAWHWSAVGDAKAADVEIMRWARSRNAIVFTHDLDFGTLLALTHANGPSVIQARTRHLLPAGFGAIIIQVLNGHRDVLEAGTLLTVDEERAKVRILPIFPSSRS